MPEPNVEEVDLLQRRTKKFKCYSDGDSMVTGLADNGTSNGGDNLTPTFKEVLLNAFGDVPEDVFWANYMEEDMPENKWYWEYNS